jgi:preprotein translocase subunit YajC
MKWYERLTSIDRRVIYILLTVLIILPFFVNVSIPQKIMPQTQRLFDFIESIPPGDKAVMISFDYTPQTQPECHPMAKALLLHCFGRGLPVIGLSFDPEAPGLAVDILTRVNHEIDSLAKNKEDSLIYGVDYVYLGWKSGRIAAQLDMGEAIAGVYPRDYFGNPIDSLPLMQRIKNYKEIAIVVILAAADYPIDWIRYPQTRYGVKVGAGLTAVMAPQYYPFVQTGQVSGLMAGMKGAAEYENLVLKHGYARTLGTAETGMNSQSMIHILIMVFIVLGNIGYFFSRRQKKEPK